MVPVSLRIMSRITPHMTWSWRRSLRLEDLAPLLVWRGVRGVLRPQKFEVYFQAAGPQYEATWMDGVPRGL